MNEAKKKEIIDMMELDGWTYKGENEWYLSFDSMVDGKSNLSKDYVKSENTFCTYDPNLEINLRTEKDE